MQAPLSPPAGASCSAWEAQARPSYVAGASAALGVPQDSLSFSCSAQLEPARRRLLQSALLLDGG